MQQWEKHKKVGQSGLHTNNDIERLANWGTTMGEA